MLLTEYETTVVMRPDVSGDAIEAALDRVRNAVDGSGGKLLAINHWGKQKLAYEIAKQSRGVYVHAHYLGAGKLVSEIERNLRISDTVLRFLTIKLDERVDPGDRSPEAYARPEYDAADGVTEEAGEKQAEAAAPKPEAGGAQGEPVAKATSDEGQAEDDSQEKAEATDETPAAPEEAAGNKEE